MGRAAVRQLGGSAGPAEAPVANLDPSLDDLRIDSDHEHNTLDVHEELDGLEYLDRFLRQAAVEVVDEDHQALAALGDVADQRPEVRQELVQEVDPLTVDLGALAVDGLDEVVNGAFGLVALLAEPLKHLAKAAEGQAGQG